jgi:hypothetical protein
LINTSFEVALLETLEPLNDPNVFAMPIPPLQRVKSFSPEEFESFIGEWGISCAKPQYKDVYRIGGSGDMGRDVIGEYENESCDYYQCKRYDGKLTPSEYWIEFGKLCYYTFSNDIPLPKKYFIIASQGIGAKLLKIIKNPDEIRKGLIKYWDDKCKKNIKRGQDIELADQLLDYINDFNFSIVDTYSIEKIIEEHRRTHYFYFRFGGAIKPKRGSGISPPSSPVNNEIIYVNKLLAAYCEKQKRAIGFDDLESFPEFLNDFNTNRLNFYSAESLKRSIRDIFTNENHFEILKKEMLSGINDFIKGEFADGYARLIKTMHESTKVNLSISIIDRDLHFVSNQDKKGMCHHLANENEIEWVI